MRPHRAGEYVRVPARRDQALRVATAAGGNRMIRSPPTSNASSACGRVPRAPRTGPSLGITPRSCTGAGELRPSQLQPFSRALWPLMMPAGSQPEIRTDGRRQRRNWIGV